MSGFFDTWGSEGASERAKEKERLGSKYVEKPISIVGGKVLSDAEADARYAKTASASELAKVQAQRELAAKKGYSSVSEMAYQERDDKNGPIKVANPDGKTGGSTKVTPPPTTTTPKPAETPTYTAPTYTPPAWNPLSYAEATKRAQSQLDPIYQQALQEIMRQRFSGEQQAGEYAAARGLGRSGLAADAQNKVNLAAMNQANTANLQRAQQTAQMAQALVDNDFSQAMTLRDQALREYLGTTQAGLETERFKYGQSRDTIEDAFRDKQFNAGMDQWNRDYILRQLAAMAQAGIDPTSAQEDWLLKWRGV
ncbi:hypothetical protein [Brevibacillus centrosporus]|uniref:hypothetical protein n=1 Tax=Brevibacillus centrosporus TaxID=54910 RepID=UPI002E237DE4|nr:hypothetical protein [Brevibacillus centrosporus]